MGLGKFGTDRRKPKGTWVEATPLLEVMGVQHRKADAAAFCRAAHAAERRGLFYALALEREPLNEHDPYAIAVYGVADVKGWFSVKRGRWHIGYVPADVAADVTVNLLGQGIPVAPELYSIFHGDAQGSDYWDIKFFVLAPPGHSASKRERDARKAAG